jgi:hypothetical protein
MQPSRIQVRFFATARAALFLGALSDIRGAESSLPVIVSGPGIEASAQSGISRIWSRRQNSNGLQAITVSEITVSVSQSEAGPHGGVLTISGFAKIISGVSSPTVGQGYANTFADIDQKILGGIYGDPMNLILEHNCQGFANDSTRDFNGPGEGILSSMQFAHNVAVPSEGIVYRIQNVAIAFNADSSVFLYGNANGEPLTLSYQRSYFPELKNASITPGDELHPTSFSGTISGGPPNGIVYIEASIDLGRTDPWQTIATITLNDAGSGEIPSVEDWRPESADSLSDFFRIRVGP